MDSRRFTNATNWFRFAFPRFMLAGAAA